MPSGSFNWVASGPAFKVYQEFISSREKMHETIILRFFYANGRSVHFQFLWGGQRIVYGNQIEIEVQLASELEGQLNTVPRNTSGAYDEEPVPFNKAIDDTAGQYAISPSVIHRTSQAQKDLDAATIKKRYGEDITAISAVKHIAEQNGNMVMGNAIAGKPGMVIYAPYSGDGDKVYEPTGEIDPAKRYGFFIGPSIYNTIERTYEWQSPQLSSGSQGDFQTPVTPVSGPGTKRGVASWYGPGFIGNKTANGETYTAKGMTAAHKSLPFGRKVKVTNLNNNKTVIVRINDRGPFIDGRDLDLSSDAADAIGLKSTGVAPIAYQVLGKVEDDTAAKRGTGTTAPVGTSRGKASPDIASAINPQGPIKQEMLKEERTAKFSMSTLMVPALVGIKPHDILFVPSFDGSFMEDWIVQSVEYAQGNGGIQLSIQAGRALSSGSAMNKQSEEWIAKAKTLSLVGENSSLGSWQEYAWKLGGAEDSPGLTSYSPEIGGAITMKELTEASKKITSGGITTKQGDAISLPVGIG
jgi:rare lipoprotein A